VVTGYLFVLSAGIPLYGRISDFFSLRRIFSVSYQVRLYNVTLCQRR
jgi:MFS family permease